MSSLRAFGWIGVRVILRVDRPTVSAPPDPRQGPARRVTETSCRRSRRPAPARVSATRRSPLASVTGNVCCSRRSSSASSSRSSSSGRGCCGPTPAGGSCSCWSPATSSTAGGTGTTASCWPPSPSPTRSSWSASTRPARTPAKRAWCLVAVAANVGVLGYFKYYNFFVDSVTNGFDKLGITVSPPLAAGHPAHRHLVLHVPGDELRDRRLPGQPETGRVARLRRLPLVLPPPRGRADRAGHRVPAPAAPAAPTPGASRRPAPSG